MAVARRRFGFAADFRGILLPLFFRIAVRRVTLGILCRLDWIFFFPTLRVRALLFPTLLFPFFDISDFQSRMRNSRWGKEMYRCGARFSSVNKY